MDNINAAYTNIFVSSWKYEVDDGVMLAAARTAGL